MSLPMEEQEKWKSNGSFSEKERDFFLKNTDSMKKRQIP